MVPSWPATSFTWYACEPVAVYEMALKVNALPTFVVRSISCPVATSISANVNSPSAGVRMVAESVFSSTLVPEIW